MTENNTTQHTEEEAVALKNGWKPKEEWEGNEDQWVPAAEFNARGEMIGNIIKEQRRNSKLDKEVRELKQSIKVLSEHNKKVKEMAKKEALEELKALKKEALRDNDVDTIVEIDDRIQEIKNTPVEDERSTQTTQEHNAPEGVVDWLEDNSSWYNDKNPVLKNAFDGIVIALVNENPDYRDAPEEALNEALNQLKEEFPEKFESPRKKTISSKVTENSGTKSKSKGKYSVSSMSSEQRRVAERLINSGANITLEEYAKQLGELGELN